MEGRLHGLDALRGIAALAVFAAHLDDWFGIPGNWTLGGLSVDLFFIISGYVMARTYEPRLQSGSLSAAGFMLARYRRLWLVFAVGSALGAAVLLADHNPSLVLLAFVLSLAFLPAPFINERLLPTNGPGWSLFGEIVANLIHALVLARLGNRPLRIACSVLCLIYAALIVLTGYSAGGVYASDWPVAFVRVLASYTIGIAIWRFSLSQWPIPPWLAFMAFGAFVALGPLLGGAATTLIATFIVFPACVVGAARFDARRLAPACTFLGLLSYPLYATHAPVLYYASEHEIPVAHVIWVSLLVALLTVYLEARRRGLTRSERPLSPAQL